MQTRLPILLLGLYICVHTLGHGQCCSPGTPVNNDAYSVDTNQRMVQLDFRYSFGYSHKYFDGLKESTTKFIDNGNFNFIGFDLRLNLTNRIRFNIGTGYFVNKTQNYVQGILPKKQVGNGISDINTSLLFKLKRIKNKVGIEIYSGIGIKIPIGSYKTTYEGAILPFDLQPTTGAFDVIHKVIAINYLKSRKSKFIFDNRFDFKGMNKDLYRYGVYDKLSISYVRTLKNKMFLLGGIFYEYRARDTQPNTGFGIPFKNNREHVITSGSHKIYLNGSYGINLKTNLSMWLFASVPVFQYYNGKQLGNSILVNFTIRKNFLLKKKLN